MTIRPYRIINTTTMIPSPTNICKAKPHDLTKRYKILFKWLNEWIWTFTFTSRGAIANLACTPSWTPYTATRIRSWRVKTCISTYKLCWYLKQSDWFTISGYWTMSTSRNVSNLRSETMHGSVHTNFETAYIFMRIGLPSTRSQWIRSPKQHLLKPLSIVDFFYPPSSRIRVDDRYRIFSNPLTICAWLFSQNTQARTHTYTPTNQPTYLCINIHT